MFKKFETVLLVAISPAICAFAACGGKIGSESSDPMAVTSSSDASTDSSTTFSSTFDSGAPFTNDGSTGFPVVEHGPNDTSPACASRPALDCSCHGEDCPPGDEMALSILVSDCQIDGGPACGDIYVDFDPNGCATAIRMDNADPNFVACMTNALDAQRWPCAESTSGHEVMTYVDCTTR